LNLNQTKYLDNDGVWQIIDLLKADKVLSCLCLVEKTLHPIRKYSTLQARVVQSFGLSQGKAL